MQLARRQGARIDTRISQKPVLALRDLVPLRYSRLYPIYPTLFRPSRHTSPPSLYLYGERAGMGAGNLREPALSTVSE